MKIDKPLFVALHKTMKEQNMLSEATKIMKKQDLLSQASQVIKRQIKDLKS